MNQQQPQKIYLSVSYDFTRKEFSIQFPQPNQAQIYQARNREARIFSDDPTTVWLPVPDGLSKILSSSSRGFILRFDQPNQADKWRQLAVLGHPYPNFPTDVFILREYRDMTELNAALLTDTAPMPAAFQSRPQSYVPPAGANQYNAYYPPSQDPNNNQYNPAPNPAPGFGIQPATGSAQAPRMFD